MNSLTKILIVTFAIIPILTGCAFGDLRDGLTHLKGHNVEVAVKYLGMPESQDEILGKNVYIWQDKQLNSLKEPRCTIRIFTDKEQLITDTDWSGEIGLCGYTGELGELMKWAYGGTYQKPNNFGE